QPPGQRLPRLDGADDAPLGGGGHHVVAVPTVHGDGTDDTGGGDADGAQPGRGQGDAGAGGGALLAARVGQQPDARAVHDEGPPGLVGAGAGQQDGARPQVG